MHRDFFNAHLTARDLVEAKEFPVETVNDRLKAASALLKVMADKDNLPPVLKNMELGGTPDPQVQQAFQNAFKLARKFPVETVAATIASRAKEYGEYKKQAAIAQRIKQSMYCLISACPEKFSSDMAESLDMIATKLSRIVSGNPNNPDHWHDIAGYATLIEQRLKREQVATAEAKEKASTF